jgi:hypothetical protein
MMKLNSFEPVQDMPEPIPVDEHHPFVSNTVDDDASGIPTQRQYVAHLPERKEWQPPLPTQDAESVFTEVPDQKKPPKT